MSWISALADHISTNSLGTQGTSLFVGTMPDTDILTTALTEYDGSVIETNASGIALYQPSLQIRVKGVAEDYTTPRARIVAIQTLLAAITNQTVSGVAFLRVRPTSTILSLGQDDRLRWSFSCNFEITIAEA
jgi:hypothetical protein